MKHSILCVDDEADNVDALERLFRRKYRVLKATSGEEALRALADDRRPGQKDGPVAAIISDQRMPNMSGVELLAESIKTHPDAVRILLTGYADIDSVIAAINAGHVYRYVTKPWDPVDLSNAVDKAVERWELGAELAQKNAALKEALEELRGLDEAKTQFMLLVNHELKTPLTSLLSFSELLAETSLDEDQAKYLSRMNESSRRLRSIVTDALEFVSAETGQTKIDLKARAAKALFAQPPADAADLIAAAAAKRGVTFAFDVEDAKVLVDERAARNAFARLLHNAAKFADQGSSVAVTGRAEGDAYRVSIANRAPGFDQRTAKLLLKPFALNENAMNHSTGTGMGLSICQALLRLHGSALELASTRGSVEASFSVKLK